MNLYQRTKKCDICGNTMTENQYGDGFPGWGQIVGAGLESEATTKTIDLCPVDLTLIVEYANNLLEGNKQNGLYGSGLCL